MDTPLPPTPPPPTRTPFPPATSTAVTPEEDVTQRYPDGESNLRFEWGMLFDSFALGVSYIWLCCGGLVLLCIPAIFLVLWVASRRRKQGEE